MKLMCAACLASSQLSRDILRVGDVWSLDLSPLELQNAETKRVALAGGSRNLEFRGEGRALVGIKDGVAGPQRMIKTKGYSTTQALSTLRNLLVTQHLRNGEGPFTMPDSRRRERLLGDSGRTKTLSSGIKWEKFGESYVPREDSCISAFVRLMAIAASGTN